ncbi:hypothetical protein HOLDEFILI_01005 [Holdemania filiformis DSM 12042]|uniref:Uncharacterized protein n=1 Tax=Holdemania filiformis DSM 12042 TaxID=545696 RepID=B9Y5C4_9FIRM|nr:hypothetical protein HOLDEFILI_01005 [Holdemania filiformis DSM 12042]
MPKGTLNEIHSLFPFQGRKENNFPSKARLFKFVFIIESSTSVLKFPSGRWPDRTDSHSSPL